MRMDIKLFKMLNEIAVENGISQLQWGESAGVPQPRISELLRQAKGGEKPRNSRYFTLTRYISLYRGLKFILGEDHLKRALIEKANQEEDQKIRVWAKLATLLEAEEDKERQKIVALEQYVDLLNK